MKVYNNEIYHFGKKGMKWGNRVREIKTSVRNSRRLSYESKLLGKQSEDKYNESMKLYNKSGNNEHERAMNNDNYARNKNIDPKIKSIIDKSIKILDESNDLDKLSYSKKRESEKEFINTGKTRVMRMIANKIF